MNNEYFPKLLGDGVTNTKILEIDVDSNGNIIFMAQSESETIKHFEEPKNIVGFLDSTL